MRISIGRTSEFSKLEDEANVRVKREDSEVGFSGWGQLGVGNVKLFLVHWSMHRQRVLGKHSRCLFLEDIQKILHKF